MRRYVLLAVAAATLGLLIPAAAPASAASEPTATQFVSLTGYDGPPDQGGVPITPETVTTTPIAQLPQGTTVYTDGTAGPSAQTVSALTTGPQPVASAAYGPGLSQSDCQNDAAAYRDAGHVIDHFNYCLAGYFRVTVLQCTIVNGVPTNCRVTGTADFRLSSVGRGHNASRFASFTDVLDQWRITGNAGSTSMTLNIRCTTTLGSACDASAPTGHTRTISQWAASNSAYSRFDSPTTGASGTHLISRYQFRTVLSVAGGDSVSFGTNNFRCDSATYIKNTAAGSGCVFPNVTSVFTLNVNSGATQEALHIYQAQYYPETTTPADPNKSIPGSVESGRPLTRTTSATLIDANRDKAGDTCTAYYPAYSTSSNLDCDEYPYASTHQGASKAGTNYSARPINDSDNRSGGGQLSAFYSFNRMLDTEDRFYVAITG
ncbi:NucA/NucB deoxyribonuclease domain-containing protein [Streptomyces cupreus]|uniref:Deoxyribonuclease NucA/NucB domain-containing protein n=1 Tax=Streptomyces cupreus TaxID=2759956 RepID=A0A7X1J2I6_9ACTN|nr:NucA/NucB deoxyribonuclease domain-containing protein [Streptomyces cupreus]MBC2902449.1 hypothetical protein [Streptomyces cupreus]